MNKLFLLVLFLAAHVFADTPPPGIIKIKGATDGTAIGNVADALKVEVVNSSSSTVTQGPSNGGSDPWYIRGTVGVNNFPSTQAVTGTFFQATQPVSIATMPTTPVTGTFFQATQPVSIAAPVTVTGTVTANIGTTNGLALDSSSQSILSVLQGTLSIQQAEPSSDAITNGNLANVGDTIEVQSNGTSTGILSLTGTFVGTVEVFGDDENGIETQLKTLQSNLWTLNPITSNGTYKILGVAGYQQVVARMIAHTSGTALTFLTLTAGTDNIQIVQPNAANLNATMVGAGTAGTPSGGVVSIQGVAGGTAVPISGSITSTVSGTVTANAGTNLNTSALNLESTQSAFKSANHTDLGQINTTLGTPMQNSGGSVTANAGTNLNTSALALSATQTNGNQKSQVVDGSGNAITSSAFNSKTGLSSIVSGQDILTVTGIGSALNGDAIAATDISAYQGISVQLVVTGTNTTTFQGSNDNFTTIVSVLCQTVTTNGTASSATETTTGIYYCPKQYRYFRAHVTAFTSGSSAGTAMFTPLPLSDGLGQRAVVATISGTPTVNTNPGVQVFGAQVASAAHTTTGVSAVVTQGAPNNQAIFVAGVTAVSGTNPTLDLAFQSSPDNGTTWVDEWHWQRITATGVYQTPNITIGVLKFRFAWTITGTTPSFTFVIDSLQGSGAGQIQHRFFDRTIDLNSTATPTASFYTDGCKNYNFTVSDTACSVYPTLALALSEDNSKFAVTSDTLTTTTNGTFISPALASPGAWAQVQVTSAGVGCTLGYVAIRCTQY